MFASRQSTENVVWCRCCCCCCLLFTYNWTWMRIFRRIEVKTFYSFFIIIIIRCRCCLFVVFFNNVVISNPHKLIDTITIVAHYSCARTHTLAQLHWTHLTHIEPYFVAYMNIFFIFVVQWHCERTKFWGNSRIHAADAQSKEHFICVRCVHMHILLHFLWIFMEMYSCNVCINVNGNEYSIIKSDTFGIPRWSLLTSRVIE